MPETPTKDDLFKAYVRLFKQLPREAAAELLMVMCNDNEFPPSSQIKQAALLAVAGNRLIAQPTTEETTR
ncbi:hypothetical protein AB0C10_37670 [Microbispora amethystogenes]|uniref:hypothetical protein n=1 Tax=Microbispora amethystogenes TaxID=1427754 RepID=UPI0033EB9788